MIGPQPMYFGKRLLAWVDRLGSVRANRSGQTFAYYPWGEERTSTPDGQDKFATYFRDGFGQDYANARYYNSNFGRFWSPDPGWMKAAKLSNPTSLNWYTYSLNDPINFYDPVGRDPCDDPAADGEDPCSADGGGGGGGGAEDDPSTGYSTTGTAPTTPDPNPTDPNSTGSPSCDTTSNDLLPGAAGGGSCGGTGPATAPPPPAPPPCPPQYQNYINAYYEDALDAGLPAANTLALTSIESSWGTGPFVINGGNDFFNLETCWVKGTPMPGTKFAYQVGWMRASLPSDSCGPGLRYALVATYSSALNSFMSAAATFSNLTATDPATFAQNAAADGINAAKSPAFLTREQIFANCLGQQ